MNTKYFILICFILIPTSLIALDGYANITAPQGVIIQVDGRYKGVVGKDSLGENHNSMILPLPPGMHTITAKKEGFKEKSQIIKIMEIKTSNVEFIFKKSQIRVKQTKENTESALIQKTGTVKIISIPVTGAKIFINDDRQYIAATDAELNQFPVGTFKIRVISQSGIKLTGTFSLKEKQDLEILANFMRKKLYEVYHINLDLPGDISNPRVWVDGTFQKNINITVLEPEHLLKIESGNYKPFKHRVQFTKSGKFKVILEKTRYNTELRNIKPGSTLKIDNKIIPLHSNTAIVQLSKGLHTLNITNSSYEIFSKNINVASDLSMNIHQNISSYKLILYGIKSGSRLKINGKTVSYNGSSVSAKFYPGTYRISITKKGYYDYTKTIKITQDYSIRIY